VTAGPQEPGRAPRALSYARANQGADRYRQPAARTGGRPGATATQQRTNRSLNRKRLWFFTLALVTALTIGIATFSAVFAGPREMAQEPPADQARPGQGAEPPASPSTAPPAAGDQVRGEPIPPSDGSGGQRSEAITGSRTPVHSVTGHPETRPTSRPDRPGPAEPGGSGPGAGQPGGDEPPGSGRPGGSDEVYYKNCGQARKAGAAPLYRGQPGYSERLDKDGDGVACG
jgi:hypothetical protein